jgi:tetratricopeptide (TPR) repeat protein
MQREAPRTLYTFSSDYQRLSPDEYDVLVIDNNSSQPLSERLVRSFGPNFHYHFFDREVISPVFALNYGLSLCESELVACHIDGARMMSPGILHKMIDVISIDSQAFVYTIGFHLGNKLQNISIAEGYDQAHEDHLLESIHWKEDGYKLFNISALAGANVSFTNPVVESNCFALSRELISRYGNFDERFTSAGGGLTNLEIFERYVSKPEVVPVVLLGEGTFHQYHGGIATNAPRFDHPLAKFKEEYFSIFHYEFTGFHYTPFLYGKDNLEQYNFEEQQAQNSLYLFKTLARNSTPEFCEQYLRILSNKWKENYHFIFRAAQLAKDHHLYSLSIELYTTCLSIKNNDEHAIGAQLAHLKYLQGEKDEAMQDFDKLLQVAPTNHHLLFNLFKIHRAEGNRQASLDFITQLIKSNKPSHNFNHHLNAGVNHYILKEYGAARQHIFMPLLWDRRLKAAQTFNLGKVYLAQKKYLLAEVYFQKTLLLKDSNTPEVVFHLIQTLYHQENSSEIRYYYRQYKTQLAHKNLQRFIPQHILQESSEQPIIKKNERFIISILGMHRSGTSCLTGSIQEAGFDSPNAMTWNYDNLKGNREEISVIALNHAVLEHNNQSWQNIKGNAVISWTADLAAQRDHLLQDRFEEKNLWLFKDPRTVLTLAFWQDANLSTMHIASVRHPMKSALSLFIRNGMKLRHGLYLWTHYNSIILNQLKKEPFPVIVFDSTPSSYIRQLDKILHHLNGQMDQPITIDFEAAHGFYEKQLESSIYQIDFEQLAAQQGLSKEYHKAMELYQQLIDQSNDFEPKPTKIDPSSEYLIDKILQISQELVDKKALDAYLGLSRELGFSSMLTNKILKLAGEKKIALSEKILKHFEASSNPETRYLLVEYCRSFDFDKALELLDQLDEEHPQFVEALRSHADLLYELEDYDWALSYYERVYELRSLDFRSLMQMYRIHEMKENEEDEIYCIQKAYRINPRARHASQLLIKTIIKYNRLDILRDHMNKFMEDFRISFDSIYKLARYLIDVQEYDLAMPFLIKLKESHAVGENATKFNALRKRFSKLVFPDWFRVELLE